MSNITQNTVTTTRQVSPDGDDAVTSVEIGTTTYTRTITAGDIAQISFLLLIVIIGIIGFIKSIRSRKYYKCPVCGESFRSENMHPETCKICGANLEETNDKNVTDKTK